MVCSRSVNSKISKLHERSLRIIYDEYNSEFEDLLIRDSSFTIRHQNIHALEMEMFKMHQRFSQVSFLDLSHIYNENNFIAYNLDQTFKFQESTLL